MVYLLLLNKFGYFFAWKIGNYNGLVKKRTDFLGGCQYIKVLKIGVSLWAIERMKYY